MSDTAKYNRQIYIEVGMGQKCATSQFSVSIQHNKLPFPYVRLHPLTLPTPSPRRDPPYRQQPIN